MKHKQNQFIFVFKQPTYSQKYKIYSDYLNNSTF